AVGAARGPLRLRRVRRARARAPPRGGGGLVAHGILRAGPDAEARARLGTSLSVGEPRHARVLPVPRAARASRFGGGHRLRRRPRDQLRAPGAVCGRAHPQDRGAVAPTRLRVRGVHRARLGTGGRPRVIALDSRPRLAAKARIRFDRKTARYLLLYPERGLVLNPTAADVAKLCTGEHTVHAIVERLVEKYAPQPRDGVERDVMSFLATLTARGIPLSRERLARFRSLGLDNVQVSIQDITASSSDRIAGSRVFDRKLEVARWVKELGFPLTINTVLHRDNLDHVEEIVALAEALSADRLELANTQYLGWALANRRALLPTAAQLDRARRASSAARARLRGKMEIVFVMPDYYSEFPKACMDGWGRRFVVVSPDGLALPCHVAHT